MEDIMFSKIISYCGFDKFSKILIEILRMCDLYSQETIAELKDREFLEKCVSFVTRNKKIEVSPGLEIMLKSVGEKISKLNQEEFDSYFNDCDEDDKNVEILDEYPLLTEFNNNLKTGSFSQNTKDFSTLIRLKAGREAHGLLSENLPIPKTNTTDKYLSQFGYVTEGVLQVILFYLK